VVVDRIAELVEEPEDLKEIQEDQQLEVQEEELVVVEEKVEQEIQEE
jgi:hypothetical protein